MYKILFLLLIYNDHRRDSGCGGVRRYLKRREEDQQLPNLKKFYIFSVSYQNITIVYIIFDFRYINIYNR